MPGGSQQTCEFAIAAAVVTDGYFRAVGIGGAAQRVDAHLYCVYLMSSPHSVCGFPDRAVYYVY